MYNGAVLLELFIKFSDVSSVNFSKNGYICCAIKLKFISKRFTTNRTVDSSKTTDRSWLVSAQFSIGVTKKY